MTDYDTQITHLIDTRRYADAEELLAKAHTEYPDNERYHYLSAYAAWKQDMPWQSLESLTAGLQVNPHDPSLRLLFVVISIKLEHYIEAETALIELLGEDPDNSTYLANYARLMLVTFHLDKARELIDEAIRLNPNDNNVRIIECLIYIAEGKSQASLDRVSHLLAQHPDNEQAIRTLMVTLINKEKTKAALELNQYLLRHNPHDATLVDLAVNLRAYSHWSSWPLIPLKVGGQSALILLYITFVGGSIYLFAQGNAYAPVVAGSYLLYTLYSWLYLPILTRYLRWRGI